MIYPIKNPPQNDLAEQLIANRPKPKAKPRTIWLDPKIYGPRDDNAPRNLAHAMSGMGRPREVMSERLERLYNPQRHGPFQPLVEDCLDMIWMSDEFQGKAPRHLPTPQLDAERRKTCLSLLWAVRFEPDIDAGERAVDASRNVQWEELFSVMGLEAVSASAAVAGFGAGAASGAYIGLSSWNLARSGMAAGTTLAKVKAVALGVLGAHTAAILVGAGVAALGWGWRNLSNLEQNRMELCQEQYGRDALLCELITGRRYLRDEVHST